jgi:predicted DNA-binding transcriptional regulator AlpA
MEIFTTAEVAETLKLRPSTIAAYASSGQFPGAFKVGIDWRFTPESIAAFIQARRPVSTDPHQIAPRSRLAQSRKRRLA